MDRPGSMETGSDGEEGAEMSWHYLAVKRTFGPYEHYSICEVYVDQHGFVETWTDNPAVRAGGDTLQELLADLVCMTKDALEWKPVDFRDLVVGLKLERA